METSHLPERENESWDEVRFIHRNPCIHTKQSGLLRTIPFAEAVALKKQSAPNLIHRANDELGTSRPNGPIRVLYNLSAQLDDTEEFTIVATHGTQTLP